MFGQQKEIECELFEIYNKNLDRFFSLIKFMFVIFGFYTLTFSNLYGKLNIHAFDNLPIISIYSLLACLLFISIALIVPFSQLVLPKERKFKQMESSIQFREEDELKIHNKKLFLVVQQQDNYYIIFIFASFAFSYFLLWLFRTVCSLCFHSGFHNLRFILSYIFRMDKKRKSKYQNYKPHEE